MNFGSNGSLSRDASNRSSVSSASSASKKAKYKAILYEKDAQIAALQSQITYLSNQLARAGHQGSSSSSSSQQPHRKIRNQLTPNAITVHEEHVKQRVLLTPKPERLGRKASINTRRVFDQLAATQQPQQQHHESLAQRIVNMFQHPAAHVDYLHSEQFARDFLVLCRECKLLLEKEPRVVFLQSPAYIFGDIHGNLEDLHFFSDNLWRLGMSLTAGNFVFLGDYVDRGMSCLECVSYLLAMKLCLPLKVFLLRGNHETRDVNGWEEHYGERSFLAQCRMRFGDDVGYKLWEHANQVFDRMPLAAVIDQDIFCVHGGIPRPARDHRNSRIQDILTVPKVAGINPPYEHEPDQYQQVASDCIWSDPASEHQEIHSVDPVTGFGESLRGGGAICFGNKAVTQFLQEQGYSYIMRAHEAHAEGVAVSKGARVFTVFSTSKDHNQGSQAMAGCILVDFEKLQVINRSPAYKNQYVHRRDSVSLAALSESEIEKRMRLGLVTNTSPEQQQQQQQMMAGEEEDDEEQWEDFEDDDDDEKEPVEEEYVFAANRRSSIDLNATENAHDSMSSMDSDPMNVARSDGMSLIVDFDPPTRKRSSRKPRVSAIHEETMDESMEEEVETVDGDASAGDWGTDERNGGGLSTC